MKLRCYFGVHKVRSEVNQITPYIFFYKKKPQKIPWMDLYIEAKSEMPKYIHVGSFTSEYQVCLLKTLNVSKLHILFLHSCPFVGTNLLFLFGSSIGNIRKSFHSETFLSNFEQSFLPNPKSPK
jgi:hypothetical protein